MPIHPPDWLLPTPPSVRVVQGLFVVVPITVVVLVIWQLALGVSGRTHEQAQQQAKAFLRDLGVEARVHCADVDTDGDGYVSCPYVAAGSGEVHPLECAGSLTINNGCRVPKAQIVGRWR